MCVVDIFVIGAVFKAVWRSRNLPVACKVIEVTGKSTDAFWNHKSFLAELTAYRELSGPYILRTFAYATRESPPITEFMILMELMGRGSLQNVLDNEPHSLPLRRKLFMARQIASGMRRIHQHGMIHRDIRPDNILVDDEYHTKIGDMGTARVLDSTSEFTRIGFPPFMPPEFYARPVDGPFQITEKLDIYTFGLTLNQLFTEMKNSFDDNLKIISIRKKSPVFYDEIISKCLDNNPKRRPTSFQIEKILELYETAFEKTKRSDVYKKLNLQEKDQMFIDFYQKNKSKIQHLINVKLHQEFVEEKSK